MIFTSSSNEVLRGFHPSNVLALVGSPSNCSTSAGRKYLGSTSTSTLACSCVNTFLVHTFTFPAQVDARFLESKGGKFAYSVIFSGGDNKVFGRIVLQNQPHTFHIVFGVSPVAQGIQIPQVQFILESLCDACCRQGNFPGNKKFSPRRSLFVIEQKCRLRQTCHSFRGSSL